MINIREANIHDGTQLLEFISILDSESEFLLYGPGERGKSIIKMNNYIQEMLNDTRSIILIAEDINHKIVAYLCGESYKPKRVSHVMKINYGVLKNYRRKSIAENLILQCIQHAKHTGLTRVEVFVVHENVPSLSLVKKLGFKLEGKKTRSYLIDDVYYDECILSLII